MLPLIDAYAKRQWRLPLDAAFEFHHLADLERHDGDHDEQVAILPARTDTLHKNINI